MSVRVTTQRFFDRIQRATSTFGVRHNLVASALGRGWTAIMSLAFVPLYIRLLGIESYGLIGIFTSVMALVSVLDLGLSTTLTREMARLSVDQNEGKHTRDLLRTLEWVYWVMALGIGAILMILAPLLAHYWVKPGHLSPDVIQQALIIMGLVVASEWPVALYSGGLMGLQRHTLLNGIRIGTSTLEYGGAVLVLWWISPTIQAFFIWQLIANSLHTVLIALCLWGVLPSPEIRPKFRKALFASIWRFSAGITGISVLSVILTQMDKIILSRLLPLQLFGYYTFAITVGGALSYLIGPIFSAIFPRLNQLVSLSKSDMLAQFYHKSCQLTSFVIIPVGVFTIIFSKDLLPLWIHDPDIVENTHFLISLIMTGTLINALMTLPYGIQIAYGWTSLSIIKNIVAVALLVPLLVIMVRWYGTVGAAAVWIILNLGYFLIEIPLMHKRILPDEMWSWYRTDVGIPLAICVIIGVLTRIAMPTTLNPLATLAIATGAGCLALLACAWALPQIRAQLFGRRTHLPTPR